MDRKRCVLILIPLILIVVFLHAPSSTTPLPTRNHLDGMLPRCRLFVGVPKSGTTWTMNLLYTYLALASGLDPSEWESMTFANGHIKRAEFACQYEYGEKIRNFSSSARENVYRLLPAFSHILRNYLVTGSAERVSDRESAHFDRFFGLVSVPEVSGQRRNKIQQHLMEKTPDTHMRASETIEAFTKHRFDNECHLFVQLRDPLHQAVSACQYYPKICGGSDPERKLAKLRDLPSVHHTSIMTPLNATIRWSQGIARILNRAGRVFVADDAKRDMERNRTLSFCPPHVSIKHSNEVEDHLAHLRFANVRLGTYNDLASDPVVYLRELLEFYEFPVVDDLVALAVEQVRERTSLLPLKQDTTKHRVADLFNASQLAYAHKLSSTRDPLYLPVGDINVTTWTDAETKAAQDNVLRCLESDPTGRVLMEDDACHQAWEQALIQASLSGVRKVQRIIHHTRENPASSSNGAIDVSLVAGSNDVRARFKGCDSVGSEETWKAEVIAHAIDRVLGLNRNPAVVPRAMVFNTYDNLSRKESMFLDDIRTVCQQDRQLFHGSLIGWLPKSLQVVESFGRFIHHRDHVLNVSDMSESFVEFTRTVITLYLDDMPHKLGHNIMVLASQKIEDALYIVSADNDRGMWTKELPSAVSLMASDNVTDFCNRAKGESQFSCPLLKRPKFHMPHIVSLLSSACVFPKDVAERLIALVDKENNFEFEVKSRVGLRVRQAAKEARRLGVNAFELWPFSMKAWKDGVLNQRGQALVNMMRACEKTYGREHTYF